MKKTSTASFHMRHEKRGAALIIVLGFVVLLSVLALAFLSSVSLNRQVSKSSASLNSSKIFAQGAVDAIIGDLRQEIVAGSPITNNYTVGNDKFTVYRPQTGTNSTVMPARSGPPNMPANLLKVSYYDSPFYNDPNYPNGGYTVPVPGVGTPERASPVSSSQPSQNGRYFTVERWNKALLMPKLNPTTTSVTPADSAGNAWTNCPDWILVGRDGSNPLGHLPGGSIAPFSSDPNSANYVVGRYAYAIYDEGGLLDANVAGYPSKVAGANVIATSSLPGNGSLTESQIGPKTAASFADLTQLFPGDAKAQADVDALVGWRNFVTLGASGSLPSYSFNNTGATNYFGQVIQNTSGFSTLSLSKAPTSTGQTDRDFPTRQSLIQFMEAVGTANSDEANTQNALQYLTSYSRDVDQPSYWPDPNRPLIPAGWSTTLSSYANPSNFGLSYIGNNDDGTAANNDLNNINPPFLNVRVLTAFTRIDGNQAKVGDPLVSKRFPLSRLAWLTYLGPSATSFGSTTATYQAITLAGVSQAEIDNGTKQNIYNSFGLSWVTPTGYGAKVYSSSKGPPKNCWVYSHVSPTLPSGTPANAGHIMTLAEVAKQTPGREPDFFELLKAAICAGSLGKGANSSEASGGGVGPEGVYQQSMDTCTDFQIIQIGANIIDQFDADGFPTWIQFYRTTTGGTQDPYGIKDCFGVENLPYLEGLLSTSVITAAPNPMVNPTNIGDFREATSSASATANNKGPVPATALGPFVTGGSGEALLVPIVWNPYDQSSSAGTPAPSTLLFTVESIDPTGTGYPTPVYSNYFINYGDATDTKDNYSYQCTGTATTDFSACKIAPKNGTLTYNNHLIYKTVAQGLPPVALDAGTTGLIINMGSTNSQTFREPTVLFDTEPYLSLATGNTTSWTDIEDKSSGVGIKLGTFPLRLAPTLDPYVGNINPALGDPTTYIFSVGGWTSDQGGKNTPPLTPTCRLAFASPLGGYQTYDQKYAACASLPTGYLLQGTDPGLAYTTKGQKGWQYVAKSGIHFFEPRTARFGNSWSLDGEFFGFTKGDSMTTGVAYPSPAPSDVIGTSRPTGRADFFGVTNQGNPGRGVPGAGNAGGLAEGWFLGTNNDNCYHGVFAQNNPWQPVANIDAKYDPSQIEYYEDADHVVRRGSGAYCSAAAVGGSYIGLPTATAVASASQNVYATESAAGAALTPQSRPIMLNRPFRSVADLGYVFRDEPYKNINFFTPESGDAGLLDVFCINENDRADGLEVGKVNLNTQQVPVLQAILTGAARDELIAYAAPGKASSPLSAAEAKNIAQLLITRTTATSAKNTGQLTNIAELVGKWVPGYAPKHWPVGFPQPNSAVSGKGDFDGFSSDLFTSNCLGGGTLTVNGSIQRYLETAMRALVDIGTTRTWNLMIDVVAQTGRYPSGSAIPTDTGTDHFVVEGEQRYWVHVAIDRYTGQVVDENVELVKE